MEAGEEGVRVDATWPEAKGAAVEVETGEEGLRVAATWPEGSFFAAGRQASRRP